MFIMSIGGVSKSSGLSKLEWILIVIAAVLLALVMILIFMPQTRRRKSNFNISKKV